jgi:putative serine protease PepD
MTEQQGWTERQGWTEGQIPSQPVPPLAPHQRPQFGPQHAAQLPAAPPSAAPHFGAPAADAAPTATLLAPPPPPSFGGIPRTPPSGPPRRRGRRIGVGIAAVVAAMALSGGSAVAGGYAALQLRPETSRTVTGTTGTSTSVDPTSLANVAAAVLPSVVSIKTDSAVGSGVIITAEGAILTNNHVVASTRGSTVQVTFSTGKTATATVVGTDPSTDLAVIKVSNVSGLTPVTFGDSSTLHVGDTVLAIGSPLGLDGSVTSGIVSALNRTIEEGGSSRSSGASISGAIQTDAAINPGNSGGALVNSAGQLVGINTAIASTGQNAGSIGVGFAISSNTAKQVADRILSNA